MRWWQQVWLLVVTGRGRRVVLLLLLLSLLLAAQLLASHVHPVPEPDEVRPTPTLASTLAGGGGGRQGGSGGGGGRTTSTVKPKLGRQDGAARTQLLDTINRLETRELQKMVKLRESYKNPKTVDARRMEHALQAIKVGLLEEVSNHIFSDIMDAAKHARPLSEIVRPDPRQVIIATTWRSGSTFLEELLASHPGVYNHYEPLMHFGLRQIRDGEDANKAQALIMDLLMCRYTGHDDYLQMAQQVRELVERNKLVWKACNNEAFGDALCYNENFLTQACHLYSWSTMKLVRIRLQHLKPTLQDENTNARIIYLVRDPRGVINSRTATVSWCKSADCNDPKLLCSDMQEDLESAQAFQKEFPGRLFLLRYEDLALKPVNKTRELLSDLGLDFDSHMYDFIESHTNKNVDRPWSTTRDSKARITYWAKTLSYERLKEVQEACSKVMASFGYLSVNSTKEVTLDKVLGPIPPAALGL